MQQVSCLGIKYLTQCAHYPPANYPTRWVGFVFKTRPDPVTCWVGYIGKTRPNPLGILGQVGWVFTLNILPKSCEYHMYYIELFSRECIVVSKVYYILLWSRSRP